MIPFLAFWALVLLTDLLSESQWTRSGMTADIYIDKALSEIMSIIMTVQLGKHTKASYLRASRQINRLTLNR